MQSGYAGRSSAIDELIHRSPKSCLELDELEFVDLSHPVSGL